jgi:phage shock protein PspC (stress-responsive transcriptional regulator)
MENYYRKKENKKIFGVCGGLAEYTGTDPIIWRLILTGLIFTSFPIITLYLVGTLVTSYK